MRWFTGGTITEIVVVGLDTGDDVLESVNRVISEKEIENGIVVSGIGSLSKARYHIVEPGDVRPWKDTFVERKGTLEVVSISGIIASGEAHLHISLSQDDQAIGGHLEPGCVVLTLAEIVIAVVSAKFTRVINDRGFGSINRIY